MQVRLRRARLPPSRPVGFRRSATRWRTLQSCVLLGRRPQQRTVHRCALRWLPPFGATTRCWSRFLLAFSVPNRSEPITRRTRPSATKSIRQPDHLDTTIVARRLVNNNFCNARWSRPADFSPLPATRTNLHITARPPLLTVAKQDTHARVPDRRRRGALLHHNPLVPSFA